MPRKRKLRGPTALEVLTLDARLDPTSARRTLDHLKRRGFVVLRARDSVGMYRAITQKIGVIVALMEMGSGTHQEEADNSVTSGKGDWQ